jgi:hypothetical protein
MKFMVTWCLHQDKRREVLEHWCSLSPEERAATTPGVTLIGRWHNEAELTGVGIFETDDAAALSAYLLQWNHLMDMDIAPVLDDEESAAVAKQALGL